MGRGLGDRQKKILNILRDKIPKNQMIDIRGAFGYVKQCLYPNHTYWSPHEFYGQECPDNYSEHLHENERARIAISQSVRGLISRGYLEKDKEFIGIKPRNKIQIVMDEMFGRVTENRQYITYISVTKKGRELDIT